MKMVDYPCPHILKQFRTPVSLFSRTVSRLGELEACKYLCSSQVHCVSVQWTLMKKKIVVSTNNASAS
jgi:hypothetical protein